MNLTKLLTFLKPYKKWAFLAPFLILFEVIMDLVLPNIMANIVNIGIANNDMKYIIIHIVIMLILTIIGVIGGIGSTYYAEKTSCHMARDIRKEIIKKITELSFFKLDKIKTGHLITVLTNDITLIGNIVMMSLRFVFRVPIILIGSIIMAILISPKLSLILIIISPLMFIGATLILRKAFPNFQLMQDKLDSVNSTVRENLGGIRVVKAFVTEKYEIDKFDKVNKEYRDITIKAVRLMTLTMPLMMLIVNLAIVFVIWYGGYEVINTRMQIGDILAFIQYLSNILSSIMMVSMVILMISRSEASSKRIVEVLNESGDLKENEIPLKLEEIKGKVEFKNVSFSYVGGSGDAVLKNINFTALPGEVVAILGATGSGKSTFVNLIPRFYEATSGEVLIDDINVKDYDLDFLRKEVTMCFQNTYLFSGKISDNIKYGNEDATLDDIKKVAEIVEIKDFIESKKEKYDYKIEQKATNLSGGEKQRVSLARAILSNPSILILDDTTSAIDVKTEKKIRKNLKKIFADKTIFIVAQRISSVMDADKIIILDDGEIVGMGNHQDLIKSNSVYQDIYNSQLKKGGKK